MTFPKLNEDSIKTVLSSISELCFIASGGFKGVYRMCINNKTETLKLIIIPEVQSTDSESIMARDELTARVKREIQILRKCKSPAIVKLGSLQPTIVNIEGKDFLVYSEEFLEGDNLWAILRDSKTPSPPEAELKLLMLTLLNACKGLSSKRASD